MTAQTISINRDSEIVIKHIGGDLTLTGWDQPGVETRGDDVLHSEQQGGGTLWISCEGDLGVSMPRGLALSVNYVGGDMKMENLNGKIEIGFVGGDSVLRNLAGHVAIGGLAGGEMKMENVGDISMNAGGETPDGLSSTIQRKVEAAARRAEKKMREAEQKLRRAELSMKHGAGRGIPPVPNREGKPRRWNFGFDAPGFPSAGQAVSDEERMTILKMLQDKKITAGEAEALLAALEGDS